MTVHRSRGCTLRLNAYSPTGSVQTPHFTMMNNRVLTVFIFVLSLSLQFCCSNIYVLNDKEGLGRVFDGIGGLSGGGVSTTLLPGTIRINYLEYFLLN